MRQGDGSDFLDAGDPRRAEIGVVYVEAMDTRPEVLTAINLLNIQGRKYVVLELTEARQVFQQVIDFDGLKQARRDLKAQLIVIAPSGSIPAELARSRRFDVFSSLANLKHEFIPSQQMGQSASSQNTGGIKIPKILAFGSRKARPGRTQPTANSGASGPFAPNTSAPRTPLSAFPSVPPTPLPPQPNAGISRVQGPLLAPDEQAGARPQSPTRGKAPNAGISRTQGPLLAPGDKGPRLNAPTPMTMPTIPPTPRIREQSPASATPLSPLASTPVEPHDATTSGNDQLVTDDDDALYAPSANQPPLSAVPPTPIRKNRVSKPIGSTAQPPENRPIVFPSRASIPLTKANAAPTSHTPASGPLPTGQSIPDMPTRPQKPDAGKPATGNLGKAKPDASQIGTGKPHGKAHKSTPSSATPLDVEPDLAAGLLASSLLASDAATSGLPASGSATSGLPASGSATSSLPASGSATSSLPASGSATSSLPASGSSTSSLPTPVGPTPVASSTPSVGTTPLASSPFVIPNQLPKNTPASPTPLASSQFVIPGQPPKSTPTNTLLPASGSFTNIPSPAPGATSASSPKPGSFSTLGAGLAAGTALGGISSGSRTPRSSGLTPLPPPRQFRNNRSNRQRMLLVGALIALVAVLIGSIFWVSAQGHGIANLLPGHVSATIALTPASHMEQNNYIITGLPGGSIDNTLRQIPARTVSVKSATKTGTGNATGSIPAVAANGTLTFINDNNSPVSINPVVITGNDGVGVSFSRLVTVPAAPTFSITVPAFAINSGSAGNIKA
ncbi:MAG: hypothetical protein ACRDHZ_03340, partial [Ktedonobacteraceae bacterium]